MHEEWQVAAGRRKGAARRARPHHHAASVCQYQMDKKKTFQRVRETMSELRCDDFWQEWKEQLLVAFSNPPGKGETLSTEISASQMDDDREDRTSLEPGCVCYGLGSDIEDRTSLEPGCVCYGLGSDIEDRTSLEPGCVCYGLGSFSSCVSARYQLAMLLLLLDLLQIPLKDCCVYDPVFSSGEREVLKELGLTVLTENEEGKRLVTRPTLFYMMHCGKALYNNLLWRNWSRETLPLFTIIGNSFSGIQDRMVEREFQRDYIYMAQALGVCEQRPLPCPSHLLDVFNDTAVITFPPCNLGKLPQSTWVEPPEPQYQHCPDLEIILRESSEQKEEKD